MIRLALLLITLLWAGPAAADEFRPAYLQLVQRDATRFDVLWKVPALDRDTRLKLQPVFPADTKAVGERRSAYIGGASVDRWTIESPGGLVGKAIEFEGFATARTDILVRLERPDGTEQLERLSPSDPVFRVSSSPGPWEVLVSYTRLGFEHILGGIDHLLFVASLVILIGSGKRLFVAITTFTLAHSITLALATLGVLNVPGPPVEATIALSIVFVCLEILRMRDPGYESLATRRPWLIAFSFGLLHGLGFAGALAEVGLPQNSIPLALLAFNVGVELGQLAFVAALLAAAAVLRSVVKVPDSWLVHKLPAYAIGSLASLWFFERLLAFGTG